MSVHKKPSQVLVSTELELLLDQTNTQIMKKNSLDVTLAITIFSLVVFGIVMISSVSVYESHQITSELVADGVLKETSNSFYLWRHFLRTLVSIPIFIFAIYFPLKFWKKAALPFFIFSILLLIGVFIPGIGDDFNTNAKSWINIKGLPSFQPIEVAKLALIFYLAVWMEKRQELVRSFQYGFIPFTVLLSAVVLLVILQPDLGSVLVVLTMAASMFYTAGGSVIHVGLGAAVATLMATPFIFFVDKFKHIPKRIFTFLNPELADPLKEGFQIKQALIAVGNGGLFGVGFGKSVQKFGYLPEVQSDTIFAAAAEELGFIRIVFLVLAYAIIAYRGFAIANHAKDRFSMLIAVGITSLFTFQAIINIGVVLAILPNTGITLPFLSYGGTSLTINLLAAGILLNISRYAQEGTHFTHRRRVRRTYSSQSRRRVRY